MRQPTTIPEYKQFCKALKLKILKQKTTIQTQTTQIQKLQNEIKLLKKSGLQLRNQNGPTAGTLSSLRKENNKSNIQVVDLQSLNGKNQVMNKFKNGASGFGITPQSIFRIADFNYKGEVQSDYFRKVLSKIDLGLTPMEISCLIYIFDENYTGFISRDEYNDSLNAYMISLQQSYLQYTNLCLEKLAKLMEADRIEVLKFFQQMQGRTTNSVDLNKFGQKLKATFGKRLQTKQIMGAFNAIDLQDDGIVCKKNFVYSVTSAMNKLSGQSMIKKPSSIQQQSSPFHKTNLSGGSGKKPTLNTFDNNISSTSVKIPRQVEVNSNNSRNPEVLQKIFNNYKITLSQIYQQICRKPLKNRLTLIQFKKIIHSLQDERNKIDPELSSELFRAIDGHQKGTIHYRQLVNFFMHNETDMSIIFHIFAIYLQNNGYNLDSFWNIYGVTTDADITKAKFFEVMGKTFNSKQTTNEIWQKLWSYFDKGRGIVAVQQINKQISRYLSSAAQQ